MIDKTQPTAHAEITTPISADLRGMGGLSEQDAELLEQAASMLEGLQNDERNRGNCSTAEGAACSAHAVRRLAAQLLRAAPPAPAAVAVPAASEVLDALNYVDDVIARCNGDDRGSCASVNLLRAALAAAPALASDTESVLIDGTAYEVPAAVAGELLSLHLDLLAAAPAQAVAVTKVADAQIDWDELPKDAGERAMFDRNLDLYGGDPRVAIATALRIWASTRGNGSFGAQSAVMANEVAKLHLAAAPAQEHATQLAGQGEEKCGCTFAQRVVGDGCRNCNPQEYIDRLHKCLDEYREEADTPAEAQEDARDALSQAVRDVVAEIERAQRKFPTWPTDPLHALAVLGEEFGELTKDVLQLTYEPGKTNLENMATEARQTAAMALHFYVSLPFYQLTPGVQHDPVKLAAIDAARAAQGRATP